jgi:hypothetical protein
MMVGKIRNDIRARLLNTIKRSLAYEEADNHLGGMIFTPPPSSQWGGSCEGILLTTSNWKTYTNIEYGYDFKYPNGLVVGKLGSSIVYVAEDETKASQGDGIFITRITPEASAEGNKNSGLEFGRIEKFSKNQISWEKVYSENKSSGTAYVTYSTNKDGYIIAFNSGEELEDKIDQILSTFKFN